MSLPMASIAAAAPAGPGLIMQLAPFLLIFVVFYFLLIRPQQKRMKEHKEMVEGLRRGDEIVTQGGLIGKVTKVADAELMVELADGVKVRVVRATITDVRNRTTPAAANDASDDENDKS